MRIVFSKHALAQIKERNLSKRSVEKTVRQPFHLNQNKDRFRAMTVVRRQGKRYLLVVVYDQTQSTVEIVTAFLTSKIKKYL